MLRKEAGSTVFTLSPTVDFPCTAVGLGGSSSGKGAVTCCVVKAKSMAGFGGRPTRGDGYSEKRAKDCLRKDWRFKEASPVEIAELWRTTSYEDWEKNLRLRLKRGLTITKEELFRKEEEFTFSTSANKEDVYKRFTGGYWCVYIDETPQYAAKNNTRDWGISVKVGEFGTLTGPSMVRKSILKTLGEETYEEFKYALTDDWGSLTECMNKTAEYLEEHKLLGVSFVCSDSSERLLNRLGIRVEGDWAFFFNHYTF